MTLGGRIVEEIALGQGDLHRGQRDAGLIQQTIDFAQGVLVGRQELVGRQKTPQRVSQQACPGYLSGQHFVLVRQLTRRQDGLDNFSLCAPCQLEAAGNEDVRRRLLEQFEIGLNAPDLLFPLRELLIDQFQSWRCIGHAQSRLRNVMRVHRPSSMRSPSATSVLTPGSSRSSLPLTNVPLLDPRSEIVSVASGLRYTIR